MINQIEPLYGDNEIDAVTEYMKSGGWLTEFNKTREFERMISEFTGAKYVSVVNSGTSALFIAILAAGIKPGDKVIVPDYTMVATANAVILAGAIPVIVDVNRDTLCLDITTVADYLYEVDAIMPVSINGRATIGSVYDASMMSIPIIEDACQSLGSYYKGRHLGTIGDIGCLSFSMPKIITTGQGGALLTNNEEIYKKIVKIRDFGRTRGGVDEFDSIGWNFKFTDIQAVIGIEQMRDIDRRMMKKKYIYKLYRDMLYDRMADSIGIDMVDTDLDETTPWFIDILCEDRAGLQKYLLDNGIKTRVFYPPLHTLPHLYGYSYGENRYPNTDYISEHGLWLPSSLNLTDSDIEYICDKIKEYYSG